MQALLKMISVQADVRQPKLSLRCIFSLWCTPLRSTPLHYPQLHSPYPLNLYTQRNWIPNRYRPIYNNRKQHLSTRSWLNNSLSFLLFFPLSIVPPFAILGGKSKIWRDLAGLGHIDPVSRQLKLTFKPGSSLWKCVAFFFNIGLR